MKKGGIMSNSKGIVEASADIAKNVTNRLYDFFTFSEKTQPVLGASEGITVPELRAIAKEKIKSVLLEDFNDNELNIMEPYISPKRERNQEDERFNFYIAEGKFKNFRNEGHTLSGRYKAVLKIVKNKKAKELTIYDVQIEGQLALHVCDVLDQETQEAYIYQYSLSDRDDIIDKQILSTDNAIFANEVHTELVCKTSSKIQLYEAVFKQAAPVEEVIGKITVRKQRWNVARCGLKSEMYKPTIENIIDDKAINQQLFHALASEIERSSGDQKLDEKKSRLIRVRDVQIEDVAIQKLKCRVFATYEMVAPYINWIPDIGPNRKNIKYDIDFIIHMDIEEGKTFVEESSFNYNLIK